MTTPEHIINTALEESVEAAYSGRRDAVETFFQALFDGPVYIPRRYQSQPMSDSPDYPGDFVDVLGITDDDRVIVPVFSNPDGIEEWCGNPLQWRCMNGIEAAKVIPDDWWVVINPGSEIEKELSPWEIERLREGKEALLELVTEALSDKDVDPMHVRPCGSDEFEAPLNSLRNYIENDTRFNTLYALVEENAAADGSAVATLLIGIAVSNDVPGATFATVQDELDALIAPFMIGGQPKKIFIGYDVNKSVMLGIFKGSEPLYQRSTKASEGSLLKKIFSRSK
jgi:hypothetical protein